MRPFGGSRQDLAIRWSLLDQLGQSQMSVVPWRKRSACVDIAPIALDEPEFTMVSGLAES